MEGGAFRAYIPALNGEVLRAIPIKRLNQRLIQGFNRVTHEVGDHLAHQTFAHQHLNVSLQLQFTRNIRLLCTITIKFKCRSKPKANN